MQRNSTNSGRERVEQLLEAKGHPTLVYYGDGSIAIQHKIVYDLMKEITNNQTINEDESLKCLGLER
jgi:hypothetical protein